MPVTISDNVIYLETYVIVDSHNDWRTWFINDWRTDKKCIWVWDMEIKDMNSIDSILWYFFPL